MTTVAPRGNVAVPGFCTTAGVHTSLAVAAPGLTTALLLPVHSTVTFAGHVIDGFVVSTTVTLVLHDALLFEPSVAVNAMVVVPSGY